MGYGETLQEGDRKNTSRMKFFVSIGMPLFIILIFIGIVYSIDQSYPTSGDIAIRQIVGKILNKDPNSLDTRDFLEITELDLSGHELADIRLLKKFKNLQDLNISKLRIYKSRITLWNDILIKLRIVKKPAPRRTRTTRVSETNLLNLRPLRNLSKLEYLNMNYTPIESISPLSGLKNLKELDIYGTPVFELGPLARLSKLETLNLGQTKITSLKPLSKLKKLQRLQIYDTKVSDIEPLRNLQNLTYLDLRNCSNIPYHQVDEIRKTSPELLIFDGRDK